MPIPHASAARAFIGLAFFSLLTAACGGIGGEEPVPAPGAPAPTPAAPGPAPAPAPGDPPPV